MLNLATYRYLRSTVSQTSLRFIFSSYSTQGSRPNEKRTGTLAYMASAGARAYNGGLGAEPPVGSRGKAPGQGGEAPLKLKAF